MNILKNHRLTKHLLSISCTLSIIFSAIVPSVVEAQELPLMTEDVLSGSDFTHQCLDSSGFAYHNGVVRGEFGRSGVETISGGVVNMPVTLSNQSSDIYVPNASVFALVYDERALSLETPVVPVDWFMVTENITVRPGKSELVNMTWNIPEIIGSGVYRIVLYHGQWSLEDVLARGVTDVQGIGSSVVTVTGEAKRPSVLDLGSVQVTGGGLDPTTARLTIKNHFTEQPIKGAISWTIYNGNAPFEARKIEQGSEAVKLVSGATRDYEIEIPESSVDIRLLLVTITTDAPEKILLPIYIAPENVSLSYEQPQVTFIGVQNDMYVACAYIGNWGSYADADTSEVILNLSNNEKTITSSKSVLGDQSVSYAKLSYPLGKLTVGNETLSITQAGMEYDQVISILCESDLCSAGDMNSYSVTEVETPFNQSFYFYLSILLAASLLGYIVLRRLPV